MRATRQLRAAALLLALATAGGVPIANAGFHCGAEWEATDFDKASIDLAEIISGGPCKDVIPSIDAPEFIAVSLALAEAAPDKRLGLEEPVIGLVVNGDARAYPLRILTWHEIVNDTVGGTPVTVTFCPLCNAAIVFKREVDGLVLDFGTTGRLRRSDLVMYDRQTQSWWQQFLGEAIVGELTGSRLDFLPARLESWSLFAARHPDGLVLIPNDENKRPYGNNPYAGYDSASRPFLYDGDYPEGIEPMARVVAVGDQAWSLALLQEQSPLESGDLVLTWEPGQNSALDARRIDKGRDVGNVLVQRQGAAGLEDIPYDVTFAFVFHAFRPEGTLHK